MKFKENYFEKNQNQQTTKVKLKFSLTNPNELLPLKTVKLNKNIKFVLAEYN